MFRASHHQQFRPRLEAVDPLDGLVDIDEFVLVALDDKHRAARNRIEPACETINGRGDRHEPVHARRRRGPHCDGGAEGKTGDPQRAFAALRPQPFGGGERVVQFSDTLIVIPLARLGAAEVEPQGAEAEPDERAGERVRDLVVHGSAVLRMRMTDHRASPDGYVPWRFEDRLQPSGRSLDEQFFTDRCCRHHVCPVLVPPAKVPPARRQASGDAKNPSTRGWLVTSLLL